MKTYEKEDLVITWELKKCIHSEKCWKNLNQVFKPKGRPWIQPEGASSQEIMNQIDQCPSGALGYILKSESKDVKKENTKVQFFKDGPFKVTGEVRVDLPNGSQELKKNAAFCRCGASTMKPYCDGSHKKIGFEA